VSRHLRITGKLMIAFTVLTAMAIVVGVFAIGRMAAIKATGHHLGFQAAPSVQLTSMIRTDMSGYRRSELAHILSTDEAGYAKYEKLLDQYNQELKQQQNACGEYAMAGGQTTPPRKAAILRTSRAATDAWNCSAPVSLPKVPLRRNAN